MATQIPFKNPFRPGAGHQPPHLAGRTKEIKEFQRLLTQDVILENLVLTGLRGVGKTVLMDNFKPLALSNSWSWVGTDLSEAASLTEERIATRLLTDLSVATSSIKIGEQTVKTMGFVPDQEIVDVTLSYNMLMHLYATTPGLVADKLKFVLEVVWSALEKGSNLKGVIFAYDEAQNLSDHADKNEYPTSLLLDVFQSIQKKDIPFMLVLVGLPTLFPKLVEARTFAERMFRVVFLDRLNDADSREAIKKPIQDSNCPVSITKDSVGIIASLAGGYPYFIQFICREVYDNFVIGLKEVPVAEITQKLDEDFFAGRWARATDRQREMLFVIAELESNEDEFSVQEIVELSKATLDKPFSSSHTNQMLVTLSNNGLIFKNRHGRYSFAVPLMGRYIKRQRIQGANRWIQ